MIKLYRLNDEKKEYWETWDNGDGTFTAHWGELGNRGESTIITSSLFKKAKRTVEKEIEVKRSEGFREVDADDAFTLLIEYDVDNMGTGSDLEKRHALETRMNETLGWTGLGHCDGGSIGSGTMEVCCFVVDFEAAKDAIEKDLAGTDFADFTRIYDENA